MSYEESLADSDRLTGLRVARIVGEAGPRREVIE